ncbi:MAG: HPP family protein [Bacteriovoracia bacterium]
MKTRAKDIMTTELIVGTPKMTVEQAIKILFSSKITGILIVDDTNRLIGVTSEFDIMKQVENVEATVPLKLDIPIRYSKKVTSISENTSLDEMLKLFLEKKIRRLPVLDANQRLTGIVTRRDVIRALFYRTKMADKTL